MSNELLAGAAAMDISPRTSQFLYGYPHVERFSTGIHDPLYSSALFLDNGRKRVLFIAHDIVFLPRAITEDIRERIVKATGLAGDNIMITATHTHSGPIVGRHLFHENDPVIPHPDKKYLQYLQQQSVKAARAAVDAARPAEAGFARARVAGIGTNRHDPAGPADPEIPVLALRDAGKRHPLAVMMVYSMHPTVLHEDSRLVSADFPGAARRYLQHVAGSEFPVLYHVGTAGDQSPRHVVRGQTFEEADHLGELLGRAVQQAMPAEYTNTISLEAVAAQIDLPRRTMPSIETAEAILEKHRKRFEELQAAGKPRAARTAECDVFGAEERLMLARAQEDGRLAKYYDGCLPAMVQVIRVGDWFYTAWPAEVFVEYGLEMKKKRGNAFPIALANGHLHGYIVTEEAEAAGGYESGNSMFTPETGRILIETSARLIDRCSDQ